MEDNMSTLKERNLKFETKQLHVGQESADPLQIQELCRFTRPLLMCSTTANMQLQDSD